MDTFPSFSRYLPVGDRARDWQLWCTTAGKASVPPGSPYPPRATEHPPQYGRRVTAGRVLDEYQLVYVSRGWGQFRTGDDDPVTVAEGSVLFLFPGVRHGYSPERSVGWDEQWVGFRGPLADQLVAQGFFSPQRPVLRPGVRDDLIRDFNDLADLARTQRPGYQYELGAQVYRLLAKLAAHAEGAEQHSRAEELATFARGWMEARVESRLEVKALAAELGLSYENFRRIFLKYTGLAPYQYFLQLKMARAQVLLGHEGLSVKETASRLAFENQYYFSRALRPPPGAVPASGGGPPKGPKTGDRRTPIVES